MFADYSGLGGRTHNKAYLDDTGSTMSAAQQRRQFLNAVRMGPHYQTDEGARAPAVLATLYGRFVSKMAPVTMLAGMAITCNTLVAPGVNVFSSAKSNAARQNFLLTAAIAQGAQPCPMFFLINN